MKQRLSGRPLLPFFNFGVLFSYGYFHFSGTFYCIIEVLTMSRVGSISAVFQYLMILLGILCIPDENLGGKIFDR